MHKLEKLLFEAVNIDYFTPEEKLPRIKKLINDIKESKENPSIDAQDPITGNTALIEATILPGHEAIVGALIQAGANLNIQGEFGQTALAIASMYNHVEKVKMLTEANANPNIPDEYKNTALISAALNGNKSVIETLVMKKADLEMHNEYNNTALDSMLNAALLHAKLGRVVITPTFRETACVILKIENKQEIPLKILINSLCNKYIDLAILLLKRGARVNNKLTLKKFIKLLKKRKDSDNLKFCNNILTLHQDSDTPTILSEKEAIQRYKTAIIHQPANNLLALGPYIPDLFPTTAAKESCYIQAKKEAEEEDLFRKSIRLMQIEKRAIQAAEKAALSAKNAILSAERAIQSLEKIEQPNSTTNASNQDTQPTFATTQGLFSRNPPPPPSPAFPGAQTPTDENNPYSLSGIELSQLAVLGQLGSSRTSQRR